MDNQEIPGWNGEFRIDGTEVKRSVEGWIIFPSGSRLPMALCPCCKRPFTSASSAKIIANEVYPE
jgi:hypothetical protein